VRVVTRARFAAVLLIVALAAAGCGGDDDDEPSRRPSQKAPETSAPPKATTGEPPGARKGPPEEEQPTTDEQGNEVTRPVGPSFRCDGKRQRALSASGPVEVDPPVVAPGEAFTVTIADPSARAALVQLAGVTDLPIQATAQPSGGRLRATIRMPSRATCGNKLITVEGDVSGQAYVGVRR
jgi:hypothetical protein